MAFGDSKNGEWRQIGNGTGEGVVVETQNSELVKLSESVGRESATNDNYPIAVYAIHRFVPVPHNSPYYHLTFPPPFDFQLRIERLLFYLCYLHHVKSFS